MTPIPRWVELMCSRCGAPFRIKPWRARQGQTICSVRCPGISTWTDADTKRFWSFAQRGDGCWIWTGETFKNGYARYQSHRIRSIDPSLRAGRASRIAWVLTNGPIPDGLNACHKCDTPRCVNPDHLFLGTHLDNARDMVAKGRSCHGVKRKNAKLNDDAVRQIRNDLAAGHTQRSIAERFGVNTSLISNIHTGDKWRHVR